MNAAAFFDLDRTEPLRLVQQHRERGERVYIVSATLQEIVQHIADDLGFDGAIGSTCEIVDGTYTFSERRFPSPARRVWPHALLALSFAAGLWHAARRRAS